LEIVFVEVFGLDMVKLIEVDFKIAGNSSGKVLVVDTTGQLKTLFVSEFVQTGVVKSLQVVPDTNRVIDMIIGTEASHVILTRRGLSIEVVSDEEDVEEVESEKNAGDGEDLGPHQRVNFSNIIC
jgi:hypothetical protein